MFSLKFFFIETSASHVSDFKQNRMEVGSLKIARSEVDALFGIAQKQKSTTLTENEYMQFNNMSEQDPILAFSEKESVFKSVVSKQGTSLLTSSYRE